MPRLNGLLWVLIDSEQLHLSFLSFAVWISRRRQLLCWQSLLLDLLLVFNQNLILGFILNRRGRIPHTHFGTSWQQMILYLTQLKLTMAVLIRSISLPLLVRCGPFLSILAFFSRIILFNALFGDFLDLSLQNSKLPIRLSQHFWCSCIEIKWPSLVVIITFL